MVRQKKGTRESPPSNEYRPPLSDDYEIAKYILYRPPVMLGRDVSGLSEVLALLQGVAVGRYPPHGYGFLPGFGEFVNRRLGEPWVNRHDNTLLKVFGKMP